VQTMQAASIVRVLLIVVPQVVRGQLVSERVTLLGFMKSLGKPHDNSVKKRSGEDAALPTSGMNKLAPNHTSLSLSIQFVCSGCRSLYRPHMT
jgi:hypothetical protein